MTYGQRLGRPPVRPRLNPSQTRPNEPTTSTNDAGPRLSRHDMCVRVHWQTMPAHLGLYPAVLAVTCSCFWPCLSLLTLILHLTPACFLLPNTLS